MWHWQMGLKCPCADILIYYLYIYLGRNLEKRLDIAFVRYITLNGWAGDWVLRLVVFFLQLAFIQLTVKTLCYVGKTKAKGCTGSWYFGRIHTTAELDLFIMMCDHHKDTDQINEKHASIKQYFLKHFLLPFSIFTAFAVLASVRDLPCWA